MLRDQDSNLEPSGYEPDELPLLHPAIFNFSLPHLTDSNLEPSGYLPAGRQVAPSRYLFELFLILRQKTQLVNKTPKFIPTP